MSALLALTWHSAPCFAQNTAQAEAASYRIAGRVVSAMDGHALGRATLQISNTKTRKAIASTVADTEGKFAFPEVKTGTYSLQGKTSGYITANYEQHGEFSTAILTGAGVDTESLVFKLTPEADLSGRIIDEAGDGVGHAMVALYVEDRAFGDLRITRSRVASSDDLGSYDLAGLAPGRYFVSASATPWYAVHPQPGRQAGAVGVVESVDPSLDVAYSTTFYPEATDSSGAAAIVLRGGEQVEADIRLSPRPALTITIPHWPEGTTIRFPQLQRPTFGDFEQVNVEMQRTSPTEYRMLGLPPGQYVLKQPIAESGAIVRSTKVNLSERNMQVDAERGEELGIVKVVLKATDGGKLPARMQVSLLASGSIRPTTGWSNEKDEVEIDGVEPGDYRMVAYAGRRMYYVMKISSEGKVREGNHLHVTAGATLPVSVVVGPGSGRIEGIAKREGKPAAGAMVLLLPVNRTQQTELFWKQQSDLDGSFDLSNVPAGRYTLLAIEDGWDLEWQRAEVLAHYLALGVAVTIPQSGTMAVKLADAVVVQAR